MASKRAARKSSPENQQHFDFVERDDLLVCLCLPKSTTLKNGKPVSAKVMRQLLFRLHQHSGNSPETFIGVTKLAMALDSSERTVRRAIEALQSLGILTVKFKKSSKSTVVCNHYSIQWPAVIALQPKKYVGHPEQSVSESTSTEPQESNCSIGSDRTFCESDRTLSQTDRTFCTSDRTFCTSDRTPGVHRHVKTHPDTKDSGGRSGVFQIGRRGNPLTKSPESPWRTVTPEQLVDLDVLDQLLEFAIEAKVIPSGEHWRLTFFALCYSIHRNRAAFDRPIGMLIHKLRSGEQEIYKQVDDEHDRAWAKLALKRFEEQDGFIPEPIRPNPPEVKPMPLVAEVCVAAATVAEPSSSESELMDRNLNKFRQQQELWRRQRGNA